MGREEKMTGTREKGEKKIEDRRWSDRKKIEIVRERKKKRP